MEKAILGAIAKLIETLAVAGFVQQKHPKRFMRLLNVDTAHSVIRLPLIIAALYGSAPKVNIKTTRYMLAAIGAFYVALAAVGMVDKKVGGAMPSKLTNFDVVYHFLTGATALWLGTRPGRMMKSD